MKTYLQYFTAIALILFIDIISIVYINKNTNDKIKNDEQLLINQSRAHFNDQVNTRAWNAQYGGVYVKTNLQPNPFLKDNILKIDNNQTLVKINPAWMTRQLSELAKIDGYHFRITSLKSLNPSNRPNPFEKEALAFMLDKKKPEYYQFDHTNKKFLYMGALITKQACMECHAHQGYKVGDIRGGISVSIDASEYFVNKENMIFTKQILMSITIVISIIIGWLIIRILNYSRDLEKKVEERTKEIRYNKTLLQAVLDAELSFLIVAQDSNPIYINKTLLNFLNYASFEEFEKNINDISDLFENIDNNEYLAKEVNGVNWIEYLLKYQKENPLKVIFKKSGVHRYFKPHAKEITIENEEFFLIIFDEITEEVLENKELALVATTDTLTTLPNRFKFNDVLEKQVSLAQSINVPLSVIFIDLDLFKSVNDTYGHDVGDTILFESAQLIKSSIRDNDFVARWGGEEFIVILQSTDSETAVKIAEKIRKRFEEHGFPNNIKQTISCGISELIMNENKLDFIRRADEALYRAKISGRNKVILF